MVDRLTTATRTDDYNRDYRRVSGMMIPPGAEVEWVLPEGRFTYWRGRVESLELP
jgi:uncharacterized protein DUF6920